MQIWQFFNRLKHANFTFVFSQILALGVSASVLLHSTNVNAAEQVVLKYGNFQGVVPALKAYLQVAQQNPSVARKALTAGIKADPAFLNSLLSSWAGPILVSQIGEVVHLQI